MNVLEKPIYPPYICLVCGVGSGRKWFVDMMLPIDNYFNPVNDGAVYLCNECWDSAAVEVANKAQVLVLGQEPWQGEEATYEEEGELLIGVKEVDNGTRVSNTSTADPNTLTFGDSTEPEPNNSEDDTDDTDDDAEPVREFREFFGKS